MNNAKLKGYFVFFLGFVYLFLSIFVIVFRFDWLIVILMDVTFLLTVILLYIGDYKRTVNKEHKEMIMRAFLFFFEIVLIKIFLNYFNFFY